MVSGNNYIHRAHLRGGGLNDSISPANNRHGGIEGASPLGKRPRRIGEGRRTGEDRATGRFGRLRLTCATGKPPVTRVQTLISPQHDKPCSPSRVSCSGGGPPPLPPPRVLPPVRTPSRPSWIFNAMKCELAPGLTVHANTASPGYHDAYAASDLRAKLRAFAIQVNQARRSRWKYNVLLACYLRRPELRYVRSYVVVSPDSSHLTPISARLFVLQRTCGYVMTGPSHCKSCIEPSHPARILRIALIFSATVRLKYLALPLTGLTPIPSRR